VRWADVLCHYLLAAVFLMAGVTKVADLRRFEDQVVLQAGLSGPAGLVIARWLPWLELTCGGCFLLGWAVREAAVVTGLLLLLFLGHRVTHFSGPDCHCLLFPRHVFSGNPVWLLVRDLFLFLFSLRLAWRGQS